MAAGVPSGLPFLAAGLRLAAPDGAAILTPAPASSPKTRVRGSRRQASGRLCRRDGFRSMFTPGSRGCAYKTASGRANWPNRDPIADFGFQTLRATINSQLHSRGWPLYEYVANEPIRLFDAFGLAPVMSPSGPPPSTPIDPGGGGGGADCASLGANAIAALEASIADPDNINLQINAAAATARYEAAGCGDDEPPPPKICPPPNNPGPPEPPSWLRRMGNGIIDILDSIPVIIMPPIQIICPNCVPPGQGPPVAA